MKIILSICKCKPPHCSTSSIFEKTFYRCDLWDLPMAHVSHWAERVGQQASRKCFYSTEKRKDLGPTEEVGAPAARPQVVDTLAAR